MNKALFCFFVCLGLTCFSAAGVKYYSLSDAPEKIALELLPDKTCEFLLEENPTTGFSWNIVHDKKLCTVKSSFLPPPDNGMCGVPGKLKVRITSKTEKVFTVKMTYSRPWEKDCEPAKKINMEFNGRKK